VPTQNDASQATALFSMSKSSSAGDAVGLRFSFAETTFSSRSVTGGGTQQALMGFLSVSLRGEPPCHRGSRSEDELARSQHSGRR
jgi:hypothetical protein